MTSSTLNIFSNFWSIFQKKEILRGNGQRSSALQPRFFEFFQVGVWPWFGASEAMDEQMPWGGGKCVSRPQGGDHEPESQPPHDSEGGRQTPFYHLPVLTQQVLDFLQPRSGKLFLDGTVGGGGHAEALLQHGARVVGMDQDEEALDHVKRRLACYEDRFCALRGNFRDFPKVLGEAGVSGLDGILVDIGVSSRQLDSAERGFSFQKDGPLDMRMDRGASLTAAHVVNGYELENLARVIREFGGEPHAMRIARAIVRERARQPFTSTLQLAELIERACPGRGRKHPATLTFQALRIEVNQEIAALREFLQEAPRWLKPGGRLVVISFHSTEDRETKQAFQRMSAPFLDKKEWASPRPNPDCLLRVLTRKPVEAAEAEVTLNPRARSARLRAAERLPA